MPKLIVTRSIEFHALPTGCMLSTTRLSEGEVKELVLRHVAEETIQIEDADLLTRLDLKEPALLRCIGKIAKRERNDVILTSEIASSEGTWGKIVWTMLEIQ